MTKIEKILIGFALTLLFLTLGNLIYLDYKILRPEGSLFPTINIIKEPASPSPTPAITGLSRTDVEEIIKEATGSLKLIIGDEEKKSATSVARSEQEFIIYLGTGEGNADDWVDVGGAASYIDSSKYGGIKAVVFEASLFTPTGSQWAYARLFNTTDKHPVWSSDVYIEGGEAKTLTTPITLNSGNKRYQVQMKTQLKHKTLLRSARVRITTW